MRFWALAFLLALVFTTFMAVLLIRAADARVTCQWRHQQQVCTDDSVFPPRETVCQRTGAGWTCEDKR